MFGVPLTYAIYPYLLYFKGVVVHELLHILGVSHEQQRPDRDDFVTFNWPNMKVVFFKY